MKIKNYKELRVWERGMEVVEKTYVLTQGFPQDERYGLINQMRRSAVSIPSNIAEGFKRSGTKEFKNFLHIALGSVAELETQFIISKRLKYINSYQFNEMNELIDHVSRMLTRLKLTLIKKANV